MATHKPTKHTSHTKPTTRKIKTAHGPKTVVVRGHLNKINRKK